MKRNMRLTGWLFFSGEFRILVMLVVIGGMSGCGHPVGGSCVYEDQIGTVLIQASGEPSMAGVFSPALVWNDVGTIWQERILDISGGGVVRQQVRYPAKLFVIRQGSCVPVRLQLLSDDRICRGIVISLDEEGRETDHARQQVEQVAAVLNMLIPDWPDCTLLISGQGLETSSSEYRRSLSRNCEKRFRQRFIDLGVDDRHLRVASGLLEGNLLPDSTTSGNGVQVFFQLR